MICLLVVVLFVAWLVVTQMGSLGVGKTDMQQGQTAQMDPVQQAQNVADMLNQAQQQGAQGP